MTLFSGIHEIRVLAGRGIFAGYFDDEAAAVAAVARLVDYKAAWATLNPLRADALTPDTIINPADLVQSAHTAANVHVDHRAWVMFDFDPVRTSGSQKDNATDAEKATAWQQAEQCQAELSALGWPAPTIIDSGNGYHFRYRVNLPNNAESDALIYGLLHSLAARYPLLDTTPCDAARPAKLPGTWARKAAHTDERPRRLAALLSEGTEIVSEAQLREQAGDVAVEYGASQEITSLEAKASREWLLGYVEHYALAHRTESRRITGGWAIGIYCPMGEADTALEHDEGEATSTILRIIGGRLSFKCLHDHCTRAAQDTAAFKLAMQQRNPVPYLDEPGKDAEAVLGTTRRKLPCMTHYDLAMDFLNVSPDFLQVIDNDPVLFASWDGLGWAIRKDKQFLSCGISDYLAALFARWPAPNEPKTKAKKAKPVDDPRRALKSNNTLQGVAAIAGLHLPKVRLSQFDQDDYLLGLPDGMAADLRTGAVRKQQREDYVSRCLTITPDTKCPTTRWARFLLEIACGDAGLALYLRQLAALSLTAHTVHFIFCCFGNGRNGKGSYFRVLEGILGSFVQMLRPKELAESKYGDDANKRTLSTLEGARLVCVQEAVTGNLDFPMLKQLSGGDTVSGASMRMDARQIRPTWKLFLTTNDSPVFPADAAFMARVKLIPFRADFTINPETTIDATLHDELPGILAELIAMCPSVLRDGLTQPPSVRDATADLFAELDVTTRFQNDCLVAAPGESVTVADVGAAGSQWLRREDMEGDVRQRTLMGELRKRFGKKYAVHKIGGKAVRVFEGVRLLDSPSKTGVIVTSS
jgi:P4 family phage/plasmid primase-like protien